MIVAKERFRIRFCVVGKIHGIEDGKITWICKKPGHVTIGMRVLFTSLFPLFLPPQETFQKVILSWSKLQIIHIDSEMECFRWAKCIHGLRSSTRVKNKKIIFWHSLNLMLNLLAVYTSQHPKRIQGVTERLISSNLKLSRNESFSSCSPCASWSVVYPLEVEFTRFSYGSYATFIMGVVLVFGLSVTRLWGASFC